MAASNTTFTDQGPIGAWAIGEFATPTAVTVNTAALGFSFSSPVRHRIAPALAIALIASGAFMPVPVDEGKITGSWLRQMNEPVRLRPGLHASRQQALIYLEAPTQNAPFGRGEINFAEETMEAKYHYPWSEPKRFKRGLPVALQQSFTGDTIVVPASRGMPWFAGLSEPVRQKKGLGWTLQQNFTIDTTPIPTSRGMGWFADLSEPVREKIGLRADLQQSFAIDTKLVPELTVGFLSQYSEPVRFKQGLAYYLQQDFAYHPRILPNPDVTVTLDALETGVDEAIFVIDVSRATGMNARVSIIELLPDGTPLAQGYDPVSIRET